MRTLILSVVALAFVLLACLVWLTSVRDLSQSPQFRAVPASAQPGAARQTSPQVRFR